MATIAEIQGAGHTSPLAGETATAEGGIVTAVQGNGFYIQDAQGDSNPSTSEGLFIFTGDTEPSVNVGDEVNVTGEVSEFQPGPEEARNLTQTQIAFPDNVEVLSSDNEVPTPVTIGQGGRIPPSKNIDDDDFSEFNPSKAGIDFFESIEGMRATAQDAQAVGPTNRFDEIFTVVNNGEDATGISDRGTLNISEDDFNPEKVQIDFKQDFLPDNFNFPQVNVGAQLGDVTGIVSYDFGNFQIQPTEPFTATASNIQPETSTIQTAGANLTVASYNVLNLDPKVENVENVANQDQGEVDDDVGNGRFDAIANQIVNNLNTPDIIGLQEIQDNDGAEISDVSAADETLQLLVDRIEAAGGPSYEFIDTPGIVPAFKNDQGEIVRPTGGQPGGNIRNGFLYNPERVNLVEGSVEPLTNPQDQAENSNNPFFGSRIPLSATFEFNGEQITVINNHFSSKGGSSAILGQDQPFEELQNGAQKDLPQDVLNSLSPEDRFVNGSFNERQRQAEAVKEFVDNQNADNIVALGDLNEFEFVKPVETLESSLTNLVDTKIPEGERYSFIFQGNSQQLDHILVSNNLAQQAQLDIVHTNNEFADQASDHEPLLASLNLASDNNMAAPQPSNELQLSVAGRFTTGVFNEGAAEIVDYDPQTQRLFVVNSNATTVDILDLSNPNNPTRVSQIDASQFGDGANSVAVKNGIVAVAIEAGEIDAKGKMVFFDTDGNQLGSAEVGVLPDKVTFSPDGTKVITANEGEPNSDYTIDPKGSVSIIDISGGSENLSIDNVANAGFTEFNDQKQQLIDQGVRIFGPSPGDDNDTATVAQDLEPEFVTVTSDNSTAFVSLQENNALAKVDLNAGEVTDILPLGVKDHSKPRNQLDPSDEDSGINFQTIPSVGLFQPDAIDNFTVDGQTFIVTANEGDAREFEGNPGFVEEVGLQDLLNNNRLDLNDDDEADVGSTQVSSEETINDLLVPERLGELDFTNATGDTDGDGLIEQLQNFGGRSFSVWNESGELVFDSADDFEQIIADQIKQGILPEAAFNNDNEENAPDSRSDDKGPEPEAITTGKIDGTPYAFIGLERVGGIMVYNLSNPSEPQFVQYVNNRNFVDDQGNLIPVQSEDGSPNPAVGDLGPEGVNFISAEDSPTGKPLVAVGNEISGSTTVYNVDVAQQPEEPEPEPAGPVFGSSQADTLEATIDFEGGNNLVFTGAGDDQIFASQGVGNNRIYSGNGNDELEAGTEDRLFGGAGNDTLEASIGRGNNRLYADAGNDDLIAGYEDRLFGSDGNDRLFLSEGEFEGGGNNTVTGGAGEDQFWLANAQLPGQTNTITDFSAGEDVLGIAGLDLAFADLSIGASNENADNTVIATDSQDLAILVGVAADSLTEDNFVFENSAVS